MQTKTQRVAAGIAALVCAVGAQAGAPFDFDHTPGRLPKSIVPLDYDIAVVPDIVAKRFTGTESVRLKFRAPSDTVVFDSEDEQLSDVRLDGKPVQSVSTDDAQQLTTVTLAGAAPAGQHVLTFSYQGSIRTDPRGLFLQDYPLSGGKSGQLLSTDMEPADARLMFPCWDEPAFRATFQLTVTIPADWAAIGNMPVARRVVHGSNATVTFMRSPRMPTYLVELTAGDLSTIGAHTSGTQFHVWTVRGQEQSGAYALANARQILSDYNDYFGYSFPLPKLDSIAIPGGFGGAMENWGAITYNDAALLITPASSIGNRQVVFSTQAHEMAHQWNGDLVTMGWWDNLWLNESFASWMAARETALRNPSWNWWETQDADKETALNADASILSHPIQEAVPDEAHVQTASDSDITYSKGQAVLRMLESYIGPDDFRSGIRGFMKARAFSNATSEDLWLALNAASGRDVATVAASWTEQAGFPLISVTAECDAGQARTIHLSQTRFLVSGTDPNNTRWNIPLRLRVGADGSARGELFNAATQTLPAGRCGEPLSVNADAIGYYRVKYDPATLATNTQAFGQLPIADRIVLLDDQWALVKGGEEPLGGYLALASAMGGTLDARAWQQIASALGSIESDAYGTPGHDAFAAYARALIKPVADQLGWKARPDETPDVQQLRRTLLANLGDWGDPQVIAEAQRRFSVYLKDRSTIAPDDQNFILALVAQNADAATFEQLHALAQSAKDNTETRRFYGSLASVRDPALASRVAQLALSAEMPPQIPTLRFAMLFHLAARSPQTAWTAFRNSDRDLFAQFGPNAPVVMVETVPQVFWRGAAPEDLDAWLRSHVPAELSVQVDHGMERARLRRAQQQRLVPAADAYLRSSHGASGS